MTYRQFVWVLALLVCTPLHANNKDAQVLIDARIQQMSQDTLNQLGIEYTLYQPISERNFQGELAFVVSPTVDYRYKIEVTGIVYGKGADFRRWQLQNAQIVMESGDYGEEYFDDYYDDEEAPPGALVLPAEIRKRFLDYVAVEDKVTLRPEETSKIYIPKSSVAAPIAPALFAAIGVQYTRGGEAAAASPGTTCSSSGGDKTEDSGSGGLSESIDRVGMGVGMGLLASQAKGELEGRKFVFFSEVPVVRFMFKAQAQNTDKKQLLTFITPVIIRPDENP